MKAQYALSLLAISFGVSCLFYTFTSAATQYSGIKPFIAQILPQASEVKATSFQFNPPYNPTTNRYDNCTVTVLNIGSQNVTVTVTVELFGIGNPTPIIAYGQVQAYTQANMTTLACVPLTWTGTYSLKDWVDGKITVN